MIPLGICCGTSCRLFGVFRSQQTRYPGNHGYITRSCHFFERLKTTREYLQSNKFDYSQSIGICTKPYYITVEYPELLCPNFSYNREHNVITRPTPNAQVVTSKMDSYNFVGLRQIRYPEPDSTTYDDDSSVSSFIIDLVQPRYYNSADY